MCPKNFNSLSKSLFIPSNGKQQCLCLSEGFQADLNRLAIKNMAKKYMSHINQVLYTLELLRYKNLSPLHKNPSIDLLLKSPILNNSAVTLLNNSNIYELTYNDEPKTQFLLPLTAGSLLSSQIGKSVISLATPMLAKMAKDKFARLIRQSSFMIKKEMTQPDFLTFNYGKQIGFQKFLFKF